MGRKLKYDEFADYFKSGKNFTVTEKQYEEIIGKPLSKNLSYIKYSSPLAKIAKNSGYKINVTEEATIQRILKFKRI